MDNTYLAHFGLVEEPYSTSPNPRYLYISPTHNLALEKTKWTITTKRGLSLVFGPVGTGKTTLARELAQRLEENPGVSYVFITNHNFPTPNQLLRAINQEFEVPQSSKSYLDLLSIFKNFLMTQALTQQKTLAQLRDAQVERAEPRVQRPVAITIAIGQSAVRAFVPAAADQGFDVGVHDNLQHRLSERTQEIAVIGLLDGFDQRHSVFGHRVLLGCR